MKGSSTPQSTDKVTGLPAVDHKAQEHDTQVAGHPMAQDPTRGPAGQHTTQDKEMGASRGPHGKGSGHTVQQGNTRHKSQDMEAGRAQQSTGPVHTGQQGNTQHRPKTWRPAGHHTSQDQDMPGRGDHMAHDQATQANMTPHSTTRTRRSTWHHTA